MDLTTLARAKVQIDAGTDSGDWSASGVTTQVKALITEYSTEFETFLGRNAETTSRTEYHDVRWDQRTFRVRAYPITTMSAIYHDTTRDFDVTAISSANYATYTGTGEVVIDRYGLTAGPRVLKIVYTGGMAASTATFVTAYADIAGALDRQVAYHWQRRTALGADGTSVGGGNVNWTGAVDLLPSVKKVLSRHRRFTFGD